jgi:hypothetical protein
VRGQQNGMGGGQGGQSGGQYNYRSCKAPTSFPSVISNATIAQIQALWTANVNTTNCTSVLQQEQTIMQAAIEQFVVNLVSSAFRYKKSCMNLPYTILGSVQRWTPGGDTGVQNVPRSAWVKTDAANKTANATSVDTHTLAASVFTHALRDTFCTPSPQVPTFDSVAQSHGILYRRLTLSFILGSNESIGSSTGHLHPNESCVRCNANGRELIRCCSASRSDRTAELRPNRVEDHDERRRKWTWNGWKFPNER